MNAEQLYELRKVRIALARNNLWEFCKLLEGDFFTDEMPHLKRLAGVYQDFYEGKLGNKLMLNIPPRFGKTRTLKMFETWLLGKDPRNKIIKGSYNDDAAADFSRYVRDSISKERLLQTEIVYADVFPGTRIKPGDSSVVKWSLFGQYFTYLATGVGGSSTGKGCDWLIVDDPVKDARTAYSEGEMDRVWMWITGTLYSRMEEGARFVLNMTRWPGRDPCARFLEQADDWHLIQIEAITDGEMTCPQLLSRESYEDKKATMDRYIFLANYHNKVIDQTGLLYQRFQVYDDLPKDVDGYLEDARIAYCDSADTGEDYLCSLVAIEYQRRLYVIDVLFTQEPNEVTEALVADQIMRNKAEEFKVESNNGGRAFARKVEEILESKHCYCNVTWFHQSENKRSRILSNGTNVVNSVLMPNDWEQRWPEYFEAMTQFERKFLASDAVLKRKKCDAPDATTGLFEFMNDRGVVLYA